MKGNEYFVDTKLVKNELFSLEGSITSGIFGGVMTKNSSDKLDIMFSKALKRLEGQAQLYQLPDCSHTSAKPNKAHYHDYIQGFCDAVTVINHHLNKAGGGL